MYQFVTPVLNTNETYTINFNNAIFHPHDGHNSVLESTGFNLSGQGTTEYFVEDDGSGNVRLTTFVGNTKTIVNSNQGTIDYTTEVKLNSLNISASNVEGIRYKIRIMQPASNDIVPVRNNNQIDVAMHSRCFD